MTFNKNPYRNRNFFYSTDFQAFVQKIGRYSYPDKTQIIQASQCSHLYWFSLPFPRRKSIHWNMVSSWWICREVSFFFFKLNIFLRVVLKRKTTEMWKIEILWFILKIKRKQTNLFLKRGLFTMCKQFNHRKYIL